MRRRGAFTRALIVLSATTSIVAAVATPAAATERVRDGGFGAATCTPSDCTSPVWKEFPAPHADIAGPLCRMGTGICSASGSSYLSAPHWARIGAAWWAYGASVPPSSGVEQKVSIPNAPATLRFNLQIVNAAPAPSRLTVTLDDIEVFSATTIEGQVPPQGYKPVRIDVSSFAGDSRTLRFEAHTPAPSPDMLTDSYDIDDVSLDTAAPPPPTVLPAAASFTSSPKSLRVLKTGRFTYSFLATPGRAGTAKLTSTKSVKVGSKRRKIKLPSKSFTAPANGTVKLKFKLSRKNLNALKRRTSLPFKASVTIAGNTFTAKLKLKAPKKR